MCLIKLESFNSISDFWRGFWRCEFYQVFCFDQHYFRPYVSHHGIIIGKMVAEEKIENWIYIVGFFLVAVGLFRAAVSFLTWLGC